MLPRLILALAGVALSLGACSESKERRDVGETHREESEASVPEGDSAAPVAEVPIGKVVDWEVEVDNPAADGWETEVWAAEANAQLKKLGKLMVSPGLVDPEAIGELVTESFAGGNFVPELEVVFEDELTTVRRQKAGEKTGKRLSGREALIAAIESGESRSAAAKDGRAKFKVVRVAETPSGFVTEQLVEIVWQTDEEIFEQHARWTIEWEGTEPPRMRTLRVADFEEARTKLGGRALFADCTEAALGANASYREQLVYGLSHWHERIPFLKTLNGIGTPGVALGDVNGDGLEDLYLCQHPRLPNLLFLQNADGTLREVSAEWGVDWLEDSRSALLVDLDNDGDLDLAVAMLGHLVLASNREGKRFEIELVLPVSESTASLAAADYDGDGRLDLYVCAYAPETVGAQAAPTAAGLGSERFVYHDANNAVANSLFRNERTDAGGWKFTDVTVEAELDVNNRRWSFAAAWEDYDNDGDLDLYVANDYGRNNLYRNDSSADGEPTFTDVAAEAGAEDSASGMSVSWGDYDRDGRMDLYVSNMFSSAGSRIVPLAGFKPGTSESLRRQYQRFARGNTLLRNLGGEGFADVSDAVGVTMGRWAWGSSFADLNNDGWEDLVVANGYLTAPEDSGDL